MNLPPLIEGRLCKRYKRFLADIELESGEIVTAHCPNSGSMLGLKEEGLPVWVSYKESATRRYPYTWELVSVNGAFVGINTHRPNMLVGESLATGVLHDIWKPSSYKREVTFGDSRFDFFIEESHNTGHYLEVKNVTLKEGEKALFPDAKTVRGVKHIRGLIGLKEQGYKATLLYVVQREDVSAFTVAKHIDLEYSNCHDLARHLGVNIAVAWCSINTQEIYIKKVDIL